MTKYRILIKPSALTEIEAIPLKTVRRCIVERIRKLAENTRPPGSEKLSDRNMFRPRQSQYRILDAVEDRAVLVMVIKVGHRKDVYR